MTVCVDMFSNKLYVSYILVTNEISDFVVLVNIVKNKQ